MRVTSSLTRRPPASRISIVEDITLRHQAEALQSERTFLRQVLDASPSLIGVKDRDGRFLLVNETLARYCSLSTHEMAGRTVADVIAGSEQLDLFRREDRQVMSSRQNMVIPEARVTLASGEVRWFGVVKVPLIDPDGTCDKVLSVVSDITEHKLAEDALRVANERLTEADRRKDEFLVMLAHELRNPLAPIRNAVQILRLMGTEEQALRRQRDIIDRQVTHMAHLLDDLLDVSRITRGTVKLNPQPVKLLDVLARAVETASPLIEARRHELTFAPPAEELRVQGDFDRLIQIVGNLLNNAAKYTEEGGRIWLTAVREGAEAVIRVRDTGVGLAPEMLSQVFDVFTQAERSLDRSQGGLGLGLTLVRSLVQMHGGSVEARSAGLGRGSEFVVRLPALPEAEAVRPLAEKAPDQAAKTTHRVLVVDDVVDTANCLAELLGLLGHQVQIAYEGHSALRIAREFQPDVILLDIGMPGMNGYEVARQIRREPALEGAWLVALTGYGQDEDRQQAERSGFDRLFTKPVDLDALQLLLA